MEDFVGRWNHVEFLMSFLSFFLYILSVFPLPIPNNWYQSMFGTQQSVSKQVWNLTFLSLTVAPYHCHPRPSSIPRHYKNLQFYRPTIRSVGKTMFPTYNRLNIVAQLNVGQEQILTEFSSVDDSYQPIIQSY